jgi:hypothetical protein
MPLVISFSYDKIAGEKITPNSAMRYHDPGIVRRLKMDIGSTLQTHPMLHPNTPADGLGSSLIAPCS